MIFIHMTAAENTANGIARWALYATVVVAVLAVAGQIVVARWAAVSAERLRRYNELVGVYSEVGAALSSTTTTYITAMTDLKTDFISVARVQRRMNKEIRDLVREKNPRHSMNMLRLHRAGTGVVEAERAVGKAYEVHPDPHLRDADVPAWLKAQATRVEAALSDYYSVAGEDALRQRNAIGFWTALSSK